MRVSIVVLAFIAAVLLLDQCQDYAPVVWRDGYSETPLGPNTYRVSFRGGLLMTGLERGEYAVLRAAEIAKERGYARFEVLNETATSDTTTLTIKLTDSGGNVVSVVLESLFKKYRLNDDRPIWPRIRDWFGRHFGQQRPSRSGA